MDLRSLLNVAYAALAGATDDVEELDRELESVPSGIVAEQTAQPSGDLAALMAAARMPQVAS
jgi:hypothetical protein